MRRILFMLMDAGVAGVLLLPVFLYLGQCFFHDRKRTVWCFLMAVYLSGMYAVVGLPDVCYMRFSLNYNFVPFAYMFSDYANSLLNVALFVPLGFFLTVLWGAFRSAYRAALFGLGLSALIEGLQIFTLRATDINDLMTNTFGTVLGWCIGRFFLRFVPIVQPSQEARQVYLVCGVSFGVMFFLQPFVANLFF